MEGNIPELDTTDTDNDLEMKREEEHLKLHGMANVYDLLETWQGRETLHATHKELRAQNRQMTAVWSISDRSEVVKVSWSTFQHDGAAAFKLSERSPVPPALSAKDLSGVWIQVLNVHWIKWIRHHFAESADNNPPESFSDTKNWLDGNGDMDIPSDYADELEADNQSDNTLVNAIE